MPFDPVHDTQAIFRAAIRAVSYPGQVQDIRSATDGIDIGTDLNPALAGVALTFLDAQASFCLWPGSETASGLLIARVSDARQADPEEAQYHLVPRGGDCRAAVERASSGTLEEPHRGATIVIEVDAITEGTRWRLEGPGIRDAAVLAATGLASAVLERRDARCAEFPLGIDLLLVDRDCRLVALPRTTRIRRED